MLAAALVLSLLLTADGDLDEPEVAAPPPIPDVEKVAPPPAGPTQLELGLRSELRSGHPLGSDVTTATTDLELVPLAAGRFNFPTGGLTLAYEPRIFIIASQADPSTGQKVFYLHRFRLNFDVATAPTWRFYVNGRGSYGQYDFNPLSTVLPSQPSTTLPTTPGSSPQPTPPNLGSIPDQRFVNVVDASVSAGMVHSLSARTDWIFSAGYLANGGATAEAQQAVPLQQGPMAATGPRWWLGPRDRMLALVDANYVVFTNGPKSYLVNLTDNWTHIWNTNLESDLIFGVSAFHSSDIFAQPTRTSVYPVGGVGLRSLLQGHRTAWRNSVSMLVAPSPDRLSGQVYEQIRGLWLSTLSFDDRLTFTFTADAGKSLGILQHDARLEGKVAYAFAPQFVVALGGRAAWLEGSVLLGQQGFGWVGFLTIATFLGSAL